MFERIKGFFKGAKDFVSEGVTFTTATGGVWGVFKARNWLHWFKISPRLKGIDKIASDFACIDIKHTDQNGEEKKTSKALDLLDTPNDKPEWDYYQLMWLSAVYYLLVGEVFWVIDRSGPEIIPIPPTWVDSKPTSKQPYYVVSFKDSETGAYAKQKVAAEDMVYIKRPDIEDPFGRGVSDIQQIGDELQVDEYMSKHQQTVFKNGAMPPMVVSMKGANKTQRDAFVANWYANYGGLKNAHKVAAVDGDSISFQILQQTMKDLDYGNSRKMVQNMILEHQMIPKELMGMVENSNRATITWSQIIYERNRLRPLVKVFQAALNRQLLPILREDGKLQFYGYMTTDKEYDRDTAIKGWDSTMMTRNEARVMMGLPETEDGDVYKVTGMVQFIPAAVEKSVVVEPEPVHIDTKGFSISLSNVKDDRTLKQKFKATKSYDDFKGLFFKALDDAAETIENQSVSKISDFFAKQEQDIVETVSSDMTVDAALLTTYWAEQDEELFRVLQGVWVQSGQLGFQIAEDAYNLGISFDTFNELFAAFIQDFGLDKAKGINDTTKERLRKDIETGLREGESIDDIMKRIMYTFDIAKKSRARNIARTETHNATVAGTFIDYQAAGIQEKEWMATPDDRTRDWHADMDGQVVGIDEMFISGLGNQLEFPGDPNAPAEEVCNCRCVLLPKINI